MTPRTAAWAALVLALVAAALLLGRQQAAPTLTVHLRCADAAGGRLSIAMRTGSGQVQAEQEVDLTAACRAGQVVLDNYRDELSLHYRLQRGDGRGGELDAHYGSDIQRDRDGFYTVLRVGAEPPWLANDRI